MYYGAYQPVHGGYAAGKGGMVCKLADSVFDDDARVKGLLAVACGACQGVGYEAGAFYAFYLVDQSQDGGGTWMPSATTSTVMSSSR